MSKHIHYVLVVAVSLAGCASMGAQDTEDMLSAAQFTMKKLIRLLSFHCCDR